MEEAPHTSRPWEGDNIEADLYRLEHNVVSMDDKVFYMKDYANAAELQKALNDFIPSNPGVISVYPIHDINTLDWSQIGGDPFPRFISNQVPYTDATEEPRVLWRSAGWFKTIPAFAAAWTTRADHPQARPFAFFRRLKTVITDYEGHCCFMANRLKDSLGKPGDTTPASWYAIGVKDTPIMLLFPAGGTAIYLAWDDDGLTFSFTLDDAESTRKQQTLEEVHQKRWKPYYNMDIAIPADILESDIANLEKALNILIAQEG